MFSKKVKNLLIKNSYITKESKTNIYSNILIIVVTVMYIQ